MDAALKAIAEPNRRRILTLVADKEMTAGEIASHFAISRPAISQHLGVLKEAGLLDERREGTRRVYKARPQGLAGLREWLEDFWKHGLQLLKSAAEFEERRKKSGRN